MSQIEIPVGVNQFTVQIDALGSGNSFHAVAVTGLGADIECLAVQDGAKKEQSTRKGRTYCQDVTIKRIFTGNKSLFDWFKNCRDKAVNKSNGSVIVKDDHGKVTCQFDFTNAWPITWRGPDFSIGDSMGLAQESLVLSIESLDLK